MQQTDWKKWCRLCGKQNGADVDLNLKFENAETLDVIIQRYFGIMVSDEIEWCNKICMVCHDTITSIIKYNAHIAKVNEMFVELRKNWVYQNFDIKSLREKYGLNNQSSETCEFNLTKPLSSNITYGIQIQCGIQTDSTQSLIKPEKICVQTDNIETVISESETHDINLDNKSNQNSLSDHDLSDLEEKRFKCPKCEKPFKLKRYVVDHVRRVHKKDKPFSCDICGSDFETKKELIDHYAAHPGERKYKCTKCEKAFKTKRDLRTHMVIHDGTGCICQICGVKLSTKKILRIHMLVHSDENKYKCDFCFKEFKRPNAYKNHLILHTGLKPYECPFCNLTFANGSNCRKHKRTVHPTELAVQESKGKKLSRIMPTIKQLNELASDNVS
ncbi:zinc finger protein 311-like isoform X2 [Condylostylus longicornis]|uniref:zinc finger protein 311-like isoform X2 n=1 Tax=Condylostylus longicornis TaxID=2530218 RepID=UPI00244E2015|nr:zinc finger protein 311-like isoform X2 [Condylostylus longicornis]